MKRRSLVKSLLAAPAAAVPAALEAQVKPGRPAIQLHTDIHVKLDEEKQLLEDFHKLYLPLVKKHRGFIDAKLLKFRQANVGKPPEHYNYRLVQIFETEELREQWRKSEDHKIGWHKAIESHLKVPFIAYLYDIAAEARPTR